MRVAFNILSGNMLATTILILVHLWAAGLLNLF
jgi:hypothetical protein